MHLPRTLDEGASEELVSRACRFASHNPKATIFVRTNYSWGRTQSNWDCRTVSHLWRNVNRNHIEIESEIEIWILKLNWSWKKISFSTEITEGEKNDIVLIHLGSGNGQILATQLRKKLRKLGPEQQQQEELVVGAGAWKGVTWSTEQIE